nr:hypothetical protein [Tanacetum cinerariifolium]
MTLYSTFFPWPPRVTLGRLLPHARGLEFKPRRGGFPSGAKKEWGLSPKANVRVLHTAQLDVTTVRRRGGVEEIRNEVRARIELIKPQSRNEDLKMLAINIDVMDPVNKAIIEEAKREI